MIDYQKLKRGNTQVRQLRQKLGRLAKMLSEKEVKLTDKDWFKLQQALLTLVAASKLSRSPVSASDGYEGPR